LRQILIRRSGVTVADVPAPLVEDGAVVVEVAHSLISAGTELSIVKPATPALLERVQHTTDRAQRLIEHLRQTGIRKTFAKAYGKLRDRQADVGRPIGYSCSGTVVQVGAGVSGLHPGDLVACAGAGAASHAELVLVPKALTVRIPQGVSLRDASSVAVGAIALQGVRRAGATVGEVVAVVGLGLIGQLTVQLLAAAGCRVVGIDLDPRRVALALAHGAERALEPSMVDVKNELLHATGGHGVDVTVVTAGGAGSELVQTAMEVTRKKGRVVIVGAVGMDLQRSPFYEKELDFLISTSYGPGRYDTHYEADGVDYPFAYVRWTEARNMEEYLRLIASGKVRLEHVLEQDYPLAEAAQAYAALGSAQPRPLGVTLRYDRARVEVQAAPARPVRATRDRRLEVAVVGPGAFAKSTHLPNLQALPELFRLRAVVSRRGDGARAIADRFGAESATTELAEVLREPALDAVIICTRHDLHAEQVIAALEAGKHVFCEKPLALTRDDLERIERAASAAGRVLTVGFNRRFAPALRLAQRHAAGRANPLVITYRVNAGYLPPEHWVQGPAGGGRLVGEACHMLDVFRFLTGSAIASVSGEGMRGSEHLASLDNAGFVIRHDDGSLAVLTYTSVGSPELGKEAIEIHFDGKTMVIDDWRELRTLGAKEPRWRADEADKGHREALRAFGEGIRSGVWPIPAAELFDVSRATLLLPEIARG